MNPSLARKILKESAAVSPKEGLSEASDASLEGPPACSRATPSRRSSRQPTIRLASVSVMSKADQQRLELLLDQLIERRVRQILKGEKT
jgi:hypothetical protein